MALNKLTVFVSDEPEDLGAIACSVCGEFRCLTPMSACVSSGVVVVISFYCSCCDSRFSFKISNENGAHIEATEM